MTSDSSVMVGLDYGDPLQFERFLQTTKLTDELHTGVNEHGHRHFKSITMGATGVGQNGVDTNYHGRAMRPAAVIAWYSGIPRAVKLVHDWATAWSEDTIRPGQGKPVGVMPAVVRFADEDLDAGGNWLARRFGDLYWWNPGRHDMVNGKILTAWMMTGDDKVLEGLRAQLRIIRQHMGKTQPNAPAGSAEWAGRELARFPHFATSYRVCTGDRQFDDVVAADERFGKYLVTRQPSLIAAAHEADLSRMRYNLPMITSEVRGTDRVALRPMSLLGPLTGSPVSVTEPPMFAVTWRQVGLDFTALVRSFNLATVRAWVYSFAQTPTRPELRFWRLEPGRYVLLLSADANNDGEADGQPIQTIPFEYYQRLDSVRFDLPGRTLCLLEVQQQQKLPALPKHMPDLAIMPRDLTLSAEPRAGQPCQGRLVDRQTSRVPGETPRTMAHWSFVKISGRFITAMSSLRRVK